MSVHIQSEIYSKVSLQGRKPWTVDCAAEITLAVSLSRPLYRSRFVHTVSDVCRACCHLQDRHSSKDGRNTTLKLSPSAESLSLIRHVLAACQNASKLIDGTVQTTYGTCLCNLMIRYYTAFIHNAITYVSDDRKRKYLKPSEDYFGYNIAQPSQSYSSSHQLIMFT